MLNPVAPYRYLLPNLYLSVADIANPDLFVCSSRAWIASYPAGPFGRLAPKTVIGPPLLGGGEIFNQYIVYAGCLLVFQCRYMPLYSSSVNGNTSEGSSSLTGDNLGHLGFVGISPPTLTNN